MTAVATHLNRSGRHRGGYESSNSSMQIPPVPGGPASGARKQPPDGRQILASVRYGRKCTFFPLDYDEPITGYVGGIERFNYVVHLVIDGEIITELIHKSCPRIRLHSKNTYDDEPLKAEFDKIMGPFRRRVMSGTLGE